MIKVAAEALLFLLFHCLIKKFWSGDPDYVLSRGFMLTLGMIVSTL